MQRANWGGDNHIGSWQHKMAVLVIGVRDGKEKVVETVA